MVFDGIGHLRPTFNDWQTNFLPALIFAAGEAPLNVTAILWISATLLFVTAIITYAVRGRSYWITATAGFLFLQVLIVIHWEAAKYATIINMLALIGLLVASAVNRFNAAARREVDVLFSSAEKPVIVTNEMVASFPQVVQKWMHRSNVIGKAMPNKIVIEEKGTLRTNPGATWMPFKASQYFTIDPPGFVWIATIKAGPFMTIAGMDRYLNGRGNMMIRPLYLFNAANSSGKEVDQGTLLRYMAEMAWFPQSALSDLIRWEPVSERQARIIMEYKGVSATGTYTFNDHGDVTMFEAKRYGDFRGQYRKETWVVHTIGFKEFGTTRIGHKSDVIWKLKEGDFHWLSLEVTDIRAVE